MIVTTEHPYVIYRDDIRKGEPIIIGTRMPVRAITEWRKFGAAPDENQQSLAYLTLAQIFDARRYYGDHQDEIERYIIENRIGGENENHS